MAAFARFSHRANIEQSCSLASCQLRGASLFFFSGIVLKRKILKCIINKVASSMSCPFFSFSLLLSSPFAPGWSPPLNEPDSRCQATRLPGSGTLMNSDSVFRDGACQHVGTDRLMSTRTWASSFDSQGAKPHVTLMPHAPCPMPLGGSAVWCCSLFYLLLLLLVCILEFHFSIKSMCGLRVVEFARGVLEPFPTRRTP